MARAQMTHASTCKQGLCIKETADGFYSRTSKHTWDSRDGRASHETLLLNDRRGLSTHSGLFGAAASTLLALPACCTFVCLSCALLEERECRRGPRGGLLGNVSSSCCASAVTSSASSSECT